MKKVIFAVMLMFGFGTAHAALPAGAIAPVLFGFGVVALQDAEQGIPACYHEPIRLVKWADQPGYSFEVAGCDYQAKKDRLVVQK